MRSTRLALMLWFCAISSAAYGQGQVLNRTLQHDGRTRSYSIYVPRAYTGEEAWPLVLNMHFLGGDASAQMARSGMNGLADAGNFLVAYPNATVNPQVSLAQWNEGTMYQDGPDDVGFIGAMLDELEIGYHINSSRIYATGMSAGGMMSYYLGSELSGRIAAIAAVAGQHPANPTAPRPLPVLHFFGTADPSRPYNGGFGNSPPPLNTFRFPAVADVIDAWRDSNNSVGDPTVTQLPNLNAGDGSTVTMIQYLDGDHYETYSGDKRPAEVLFYRIEGGGHSWPSGMGHPGFVGNVNRDINGSEEIWKFFSRHEVAAGPVSTWGTDADGSWSQAANWNNGVVRNAVDAEALFRAVITQPRTVSADMPITVGRIDFESSKSYTIAGPNSITFDVAKGSANVNVHSGSHTISAPVILTDNAVLSVWPAASNLSITGTLTASGRSLSKAGAGTLTVNHVRAQSLSIIGGTVAIAPNPGAPGQGTSALGALSIAGAINRWTAKLDLSNNDAVVQSSAANKAANFARLYNQLKQGFNEGTWMGLGITSATAAANTNADTGISVVDNALLGYGDFSGQTVTADSILLKYTYYGDIDQNGQVDADDLTVFASNFGRASGATQVDGDIDFNGAVNADDLTVFANNFNKGVGSPLAAASVQPVPEPATLYLAGSAGLLLFLMKRRIRQA